MKKTEKYGTTVNGIEWEIDLKKERLVGVNNPKLVRILSKEEIKHIKKLIKEKNGREKRNNFN